MKTALAVMFVGLVCSFSALAEENVTVETLKNSDAPRYYAVECIAQNRRGFLFRAVGYDPYLTQRRALDRCYAYSTWCRALGCRPY